MFEASQVTLDPAVTRVPVRVAVFNLLRHFGMTTIFGNPGSTELPMLRISRMIFAISSVCRSAA